MEYPEGIDLNIQHNNHFHFPYLSLYHIKSFCLSTSLMDSLLLSHNCLFICPWLLFRSCCVQASFCHFSVSVRKNISPLRLTKRVITLPKVWCNWHCQASKLFSDGDELFCFASCLQYRAHIPGVHQPLQINLRSLQDIPSLFVSPIFFFSVILSGSTGWKYSGHLTLHAIAKQLVQVLPFL